MSFQDIWHFWYGCTCYIEYPMSVGKSTILCRGLWEKAIADNTNMLRTQGSPSHSGWLCGQKPHSSCIIHRAVLPGGIPLIPFILDSLVLALKLCLGFAWMLGLSTSTPVLPRHHPNTHMAAPIFWDPFHSSYLSFQLSFPGLPAPDSGAVLKKAHFYIEVHCTWGRCMCRGPGMSRDLVQKWPPREHAFPLFWMNSQKQTNNNKTTNQIGMQTLNVSFF